MLDNLTNPDLIEQVLKDQSATPPELELAYRLRDAIDEINRMSEEIGTLLAQADHNETALGGYRWR